MIIDPANIAHKINDLFQEEEIPDSAALVILCAALGSIIAKMSEDHEDALEGADFCSALIHNACQDCEPDGPEVSYARH